MADVTFLGHTADPEELRAVAAAADDSAAWRERVMALPACARPRNAREGDPADVADRLRKIALFLERRRDGVPFGGPELAEAAARLNAATARRRQEHPEWFRDRRRRT